MSSNLGRSSNVTCCFHNMCTLPHFRVLPATVQEVKTVYNLKTTARILMQFHTIMYHNCVFKLRNEQGTRVFVCPHAEVGLQNCVRSLGFNGV